MMCGYMETFHLLYDTSKQFPDDFVVLVSKSKSSLRHDVHFGSYVLISKKVGAGGQFSARLPGDRLVPAKMCH